MLEFYLASFTLRRLSDMKVTRLSTFYHTFVLKLQAAVIIIIMIIVYCEKQRQHVEMLSTSG